MCVCVCVYARVSIGLPMERSRVQCPTDAVIVSLSKDFTHIIPILETCPIFLRDTNLTPGKICSPTHSDYVVCRYCWVSVSVKTVATGFAFCVFPNANALVHVSHK